MTAPTITPVPTAVSTVNGDDPPVEWIIVAAGALLLAAIALYLVYRSRRHRFSAPDQPLAPFGRGVTHAADAVLGTEESPRLALAGPAAARVVAAFGSEADATPTMATLLWEAFAADEDFPAVLRELGASDGAIREGRPLVVRHAGGRRHDLMVLDPGYSGEPSGRAIRLDTATLVSVLRQKPLSWKTLLARGEGPWASLDQATVVEALSEMATAGGFAMMVAPYPRMDETHAPSPAWSVMSTDGEGNGEEATVGAVVRTADGDLAVTAALHAVRDAASVSVRGRPGRVISRHEPTDSCLLSAPGLEPEGDARGRAGALRGASPRQEPATFDGLASGLKTTFVQAWSPNVHSEQDMLAAMVFTNPDTAQGDSGTALIDSDDRIIGFAAYRSGRGEAMSNSVWVWADQVFRVHGAYPAGEGDAGR